MRASCRWKAAPPPFVSV